MNMTAVLTQMGTLVFLMAVGYLCAKLGVTGPAFTRSSSRMVLDVLLVATVIHSALSTDMQLGVGSALVMIAAFTLMMVIFGVLGYAAARLMRLDKEHGGVAAFTILFPNTVFVAYPIIEGIYGAQGIFVASLSNIPFNFMAYTIGLAIIRGGGLREMRWRDTLNAPLIASVLAAVMLLLGVKLPAPVVNAIGTLGKATVPVSMLIIGTSLGAISFKQALSDWRVYAVCFVRLIIAPLLVWAIMKPLIHDKMLMDVITVLATAPSALIATIFAIRYECNETFASQCVFISTVFSALTMPAMLWLLC